MPIKRLVFIHGNLDVPASFDELLPLLPPAKTRCINLEDDFNVWDANQPVTARTVAERVAQAYRIGPYDVLIGHSMGGWVAAHMKELTGARVIQLSSWTDQRKIKAPIRRLTIIRAIINSGVVQHPVCISLAKRLYPFRQSRTRIRAAMDRVQHMNPAYMIWQYELIFNAAPPLTLLPDLRIHDPHDRVIGPPDEPFVNVPGNHKIHATNAAGVAEAIGRFLKSTV
ncbi:alpha/beta fold hydrolase [Fibrella aquatica]|uniref:alpha/beta fold hydrolase n=1 Tax=Fibrella aquatica TaxID=3242487 RepID=UPI003520200A